ncbi:MAG TPA: ribokinase [Anaerolineales bacterium]|nr:ribokinase [Anaerolineales bacterium]
MSGHILVVGGLNMDLVIKTPRYPEYGENLIGSDFNIYPGGKGANQAVAAARLGASVKMVGRLGTDAFGETLLEAVTQSGVETAYIQRDAQAATGVAVIIVDSRGQNTIVVAHGANDHLTPEDISAAEDAFRNASVMVLQLEIPLPATARAIQLGRKHGAQVVLNPGPARVVDAAFLSEVDYLIPNQNELATLTGMKSIPEAVNTLRSWGVQQVIVTLGSDGVLVVGDDLEVNLPAHQVQVVDTTAAGDSFVGAFAVALNEGLPTRQAAAWANAAGALAVTKAGAQPSLPTRAELNAFIRTSSR